MGRNTGHTAGHITQAVLAHACIDIDRMTHGQKVVLADEIFKQQPNLLTSVLMLPRMGASLPQVEVVLHVLLVTHQAMKRSGHIWPLITEQMQEQCLQRLTARMRFNDDLPPALAHQIAQQFCDEHPELYLLAFVYGYLREHHLLGVHTEAEKYLLLVALNLVECLVIDKAPNPFR